MLASLFSPQRHRDTEKTKQPELATGLAQVSRGARVNPVGMICAIRRAMNFIGFLTRRKYTIF
jgi:hypothetical protein